MDDPTAADAGSDHVIRSAYLVQPGEVLPVGVPQQLRAVFRGRHVGFRVSRVPAGK